MKIVKLVSTFIAGFVIGAILMNILHMHVRSTERQINQTMLKTEQEVLARRAERENNKLGTVLHRWAVVEAESQNGFRILQNNYNYNKSTDDSFFWPFRLLLHKLSYSSKEIQKSQIKGGKAVEGIDRGILATALEAIGEKEKAEEQWELAKEYSKRKSIEDTKKLVSDLLAQEKAFPYQELEKGILQETEKAQQKNRGDRE